MRQGLTLIHHRLCTRLLMSGIALQLSLGCASATRRARVVPMDPASRGAHMLSVTRSPPGSGALSAHIRSRCELAPAADVQVLAVVTSHPIDSRTLAASDFEADGSLKALCVTPGPQQGDVRTLWVVLPGGTVSRRLKVVGEVRTRPMSWGQLDLRQDFGAPIMDAPPWIVSVERIPRYASHCTHTRATRAVRVIWSHAVVSRDAAPDYLVTVLGDGGLLEQVVALEQPGAQREGNVHELCLGTRSFPVEVTLPAGRVRANTGVVNLRARAQP